VVGELHPKVLEAFELSDAAYLIEIDSGKLLSLTDALKKYQPIPRYPSTSRDIALLVDEKVTYQQICDVVQKFSLVNSVALFDLYAGEQVPAGKKSLAFRIIYQSPTHTLTDNEVDKVQQQVLDKLQHDFSAILRS
jgi:phenylalanyl-tRNA synthetase beta chain